MKITRNSVLTVLVFLVGVCKGSSPVTCSSNNTACEAHEENTLETYFGVPSLEECRVLCQNNYQCKFLTYYREEGQAKHACFLFSSCEEAAECGSCVSETSNCERRCDAPFSGVLEENVLEDILDVASVSDCREICKSKWQKGCKFYTYYQSPQSVFSQMCFLLTHLIEPYERSDGILTGPVHCDESFSSLCAMRIDGVLHQSFMFTNTSSETNVELRGDDNCQMRILAVGGGGDGTSSHYSGGGSGFLQIHEQDIPLGVSNMAVSAGPPGESSRVTVNGEVLVEAGTGEDADGDHGGRGYSGGGYYSNSSNPVHGGSAGSDGEAEDGWDGRGGEGTGEDVTKYSFNHFVLTPGAGGYRRYGGGGGGVLVNGGGPVRDHEGQGEGYGGGGEGRASPSYGLPGLVIIELGPK